jgi:hypothetical protein
VCTRKPTLPVATAVILGIGLGFITTMFTGKRDPLDSVSLSPCDLDLRIPGLLLFRTALALGTRVVRSAVSGHVFAKRRTGESMAVGYGTVRSHLNFWHPRRQTCGPYLCTFCKRHRIVTTQRSVQPGPCSCQTQRRGHSQAKTPHLKRYVKINSDKPTSDIDPNDRFTLMVSHLLYCTTGI